MSQATSSKWIKTDHGAHAEPHDPHELEQFLDSLGLNYYLSADEYATDALVSLDPKKLDAYLAAEKADDAFKVGQLFGYPETAIEAFVHDASLDFEAHDELMKKAGIPDMMPSFRLSKTHAPEELAVLKDWHQTLKEYELI